MSVWCQGRRLKNIPEDVDRDGSYELHTTDSTFDYWNTDGAHSLSPSVILSWQHGRLTPTAKLMTVARPSPAELQERFAAAQNSAGEGVSIAVIR